MSDVPLNFADDAPKKSPWEEDRLGYAPFAKRLAETILGLSAPNGYVIGLHGAWGSGKSTALQFVQAYIKEHRVESGLESPLLVIDFRPWMVSGHTDLVSAFFKVLSDGVLPDRTRWWRRFLRRTLRLTKQTSDPVVDAAAKVAVAAYPLAAPVIGGGAGILKSSFGAMTKRWLEEPSLQSAYEELAENLRARECKILVVVDDIDRLAAEEIRSMMQMVKTVGSLPNVIYLLSYDRTIVARSLSASEFDQTVRPSFAEKIVQHELELPVPPRDALLNMLNSEIGFLPVEKAPMRQFELMQSGINRWVKSPRDVGRLANAIKFAWPAIRGDVDAFDFLCMEAIRLFEPELFSWIRVNREFLMGDSFRFTAAADRDAHISAFKDELPHATRADNIRVVCALFPQRAKDIQGKGSFGGESWSSLQLRRGIAFGSSYDAYFRLHPQADAVRKQTVDLALASLDNKELQVSTLRRYIEDKDHSVSLTRQYLQEVRYRLQDGSLSARPSQQLLDAIFAVADEIIDLRDSPGGLEFAPIAYLDGLITTFFNVLQQQAAGDMVVEAFKAASSIAFCARLFVDFGRQLAVFPGDQRFGTAVTRAQFETISARMLILIQSGFKSGDIDNAPVFFDVARAWAFLENESEPKTWLTRGAMTSPRFLSKLAYGLLTLSTSTAGSFWQFSDRELESWYDRDQLLKACEKHKDAALLTDDERARVHALQTGLSNLQEGSE